MKLNRTVLYIAAVPAWTSAFLPSQHHIYQKVSSVSVPLLAAKNDDILPNVTNENKPMVRKSMLLGATTTAGLALSFLLGNSAPAVAATSWSHTTTPTVTVAAVTGNDDTYNDLELKATAAQTAKQVEADKAAKEAYSKAAAELKKEAQMVDKEGTKAILEAKKAEKEASVSLSKALTDEIAATKSGDPEATALAEAEVDRSRSAAEAAERVVAQDLAKEARLQAAAAKAEATASMAERRMLADQQQAADSKKTVVQINAKKKLAMKEADKKNAEAKWTNPTGGKILPKETISDSALAYVRSLK
eukprot:scaffold38372_cov244-Amphora_coffeaeformis.AAC.1